MIKVRVALGILAMGTTLAACGDDSPTPSDQKLVYLEQSAGGVPAGRIVSVAADGGQRNVLWELPAPAIESFDTYMYPSPSGHTILVLDGSSPSVAWFTLPATGGTRTSFLAPTDAFVPRWSPDESSIAWIVTTTTMQLGIAAPGSSSITLLTPDTLSVAEAQWSPDGAQLAFWAYDPDNSEEAHVYTVSRAGGSIHPLATDPDNRDYSPAWSPAGDLIAFVRQHNGISESNGIWVSRPDGTEQRRISAGVFAAARGLYWSPDGTELMATMPTQGYTRVSFATGAQTAVGHFGAIDATNPWSPDGTRVTYPGRTPPDVNNNTGPSVVVATPSGTEPVQVSPDSVYGFHQVWLPPVR